MAFGSQTPGCGNSMRSTWLLGTSTVKLRKQSLMKSSPLQVQLSHFLWEYQEITSIYICLTLQIVWSMWTMLNVIWHTHAKLFFLLGCEPPPPHLIRKKKMGEGLHFKKEGAITPTSAPPTPPPPPPPPPQHCMKVWQNTWLAVMEQL